MNSSRYLREETEQTKKVWEFPVACETSDRTMNVMINCENFQELSEKFWDILEAFRKNIGLTRSSVNFMFECLENFENLSRKYHDVQTISEELGKLLTTSVNLWRVWENFKKFGKLSEILRNLKDILRSSKMLEERRQVQGTDRQIKNSSKKINALLRNSGDSPKVQRTSDKFRKELKKLSDKLETNEASQKCSNFQEVQEACKKCKDFTQSPCNVFGVQKNLPKFREPLWSPENFPETEQALDKFSTYTS